MADTISLRDKVRLGLGSTSILRTVHKAKRDRDDELLEQFRVGDFSGMARELQEVIAYDQPALRYVGVVGRVCRQLAQQYVRQPLRRFEGGADLGRVYADSGIDTRMRIASEKAVAHNCQIVIPEVSGPGRVRLHLASPHEVEVEYADPWLAGPASLRDASRLTVRVPLVYKADQIVYGTRVWTPDEAWTTYPDGREVPVFGARRHGIGRIPAFSVRLEEPSPGEHLPSPPYDLLSTAIAANIAISDLLHIASRQCHGQWIVNGNGARRSVEEMVIGVDYAIALESAAVNELSMTLVQGNPALDRYVQAVDYVLRLYATQRGLPPDALSASSGITGEAKAWEMLAAEEERRRVESVWREAEQELAGCVVDVLAASGQPGWVGAQAPSVWVDYRYVERQGNTLQEAQAREMAIRQGLDSVVEIVERTEGISAADAEARVLERLEQFKRLRQAGPDMAGMDALDKSVPAPAMGDAPAADVAPEAALADKEINPPNLSLNGAQVAAMVQVAEAVSSGALGEDAGVQILAFAFGVDEATARRMVRGGRPVQPAGFPQ